MGSQIHSVRQHPTSHFNSLPRSWVATACVHFPRYTRNTAEREESTRNAVGTVGKQGSNKATKGLCLRWRLSLLGWRPSLLGWGPSLVGWRPFLLSSFVFVLFQVSSGLLGRILGDVLSLLSRLPCKHRAISMPA